MFIRETGDWTRYRKLPGLSEIDFHRGRRPWNVSYSEAMAKIHEEALDELRTAQRDGFRYVLFNHGHSTSRRGKTTTRSVIRGLMRSPDATPYIVRSRSIQHDSVFVAAIRTQ